jgi:L-lactate utilization protein LutB
VHNAPTAFEIYYKLHNRCSAHTTLFHLPDPSRLPSPPNPVISSLLLYSISNLYHFYYFCFHCTNCTPVLPVRTYVQVTNQSLLEALQQEKAVRASMHAKIASNAEEVKMKIKIGRKSDENCRDNYFWIANNYFWIANCELKAIQTITVYGNYNNVHRWLKYVHSTNCSWMTLSCLWCV